MNSKVDKNDSESKIISLKTSLLGRAAGILRKSVYTADEGKLDKKIKDIMKKVLPLMVSCRIQISILNITEIENKTRKLYSFAKKTSFYEKISLVETANLNVTGFASKSKLFQSFQ